jgi:polysaccharide pyruvyl transferase WcaK-like protein
MKKMKLLVINEGFSNNLGDQIINKSFEYLISDKPEIKILHEDLNRSRIDKDYKKKSIKYKKSIFFLLKIFFHRSLWVFKNIKRITLSVRKCNYAIFGGGQLLVDNNIFPFSIFVWTFILTLSGIKYSFFSIGTQGSYSKVGRWLLQKALNNSDHIFVRDQLSKRIIMQNFEILSNITYDIGFLLKKNKYASKNKSESSFLLGIVDFNVYKNFNTKPISKENYYEEWIRMIGGNEALSDYNLFYSTAEDRSESLLFKKYALIKYGLNIKMMENFNVNDFVENILDAKKIVSGRMHSLIIAKRFNIDYLTFMTSEKIVQFNLIYKNLELEKIQKKIKNDFNSLF